MTRYFRPKARLAVTLATLFVTAAGCAERGPRRDLTKVQAFLCSQPRQADCTNLPRGKPIPRDSLPPANEAFQLWAWHPGHGLVEYRAEWKSRFFNDTSAPVAPRLMGTDFKAAGDSTMLSYNFKEATKTRYVVRVLLMTPRGKIEDQDSLVWDYTNAPVDSTAEDHSHHHH